MFVFDVNNTNSSVPEFLEAPSILLAVLLSPPRFQMSIFEYEHAYNACATQENITDDP